MTKPELYNKTVEWVDIPGFEGFYQSGSNGVIRSLDRTVTDKNNRPRRVKGVELMPFIDKAGYHTVNFHVGSKSITKLVHRLVALAFFGHSDLPVDHKDDDKSNNHKDNLSYMTTQDNVLKMAKRKKKSSKYHYVYFKNRVNKWAAIEPLTNRQIGYYNTEEEAHKGFLFHTKKI